MKGICVLGSTGSIGINTLDVIARHPDLYRVVSLTAHKNIEELFKQCLAHKPDFAVVVDRTQADILKQRLKDSSTLNVAVLSGIQALEEVVQLPQVDSVMAAIVGAAGLIPTLAAARAGKCVLLANKEALVMSGILFMEAVTHQARNCYPSTANIMRFFNACLQTIKPGAL